MKKTNTKKMVKNRSVKKLVIKTVVISVALIAGLAIIAFLGLMYISGAFHRNQAKADMGPFVAGIERLGAKRICTNGDSGYGIDNSTPWYDAYFEIADTPKLKEEVVNIARDQGLPLQTTEPYGLFTRRDDGKIIRNDTYEVVGQNSDYLAYDSNTKHLKVSLYRDTSIPLDCSDIDINRYGEEHNTNGGVIIEVDYQLPEVKR